MRISLDVDGVIAKSPVRGLAVREHRGDLDALPPDIGASASPSPPNRLREFVEFLRFAWRTPAPGAEDALRALSGDGHTLVLVTGRSVQGKRVLESWLMRYGLSDYVSDLQMSPRKLHTWEHKLVTCRALQLVVHVDDDPHTARYVAHNGVERVFLVDPELTVRDDLPANVTTVKDLAAVAAALAGR